MTSVFINGVMQVPGVDYVYSADRLSFLVAPNTGAVVDVYSDNRLFARILGDGYTNILHLTVSLSEQDKIVELMRDVLKHYTNPAVADILEKLSVVITLVKEDGR